MEKLVETTIDIDVGGTFTDCVVLRGDRIARGKALSTPGQLSIGFRKAMENAGEQLGMDFQTLVREADVIRYSTTLATNAIIERSGPRLGMLTTAGHEQVLMIGRGRLWGDWLPVSERRHLVYKYTKPEPLISPELTVGIRERVDSFGKEIIPINLEEVREKVRYLIGKGVRGFVVVFLWSFLNPAHEQAVREIIEQECPAQSLGKPLVLLSSEVQPKWHEYARANVTVINAYLHEQSREELSKLNSDLREQGYVKPMVIIKSIGGVSKLSRTTALDTAGAGPIAGLFASAYLSQLYGIPRVLASDMGGTSFDYGIVKNGDCAVFRDYPMIVGWGTERSMIEVKSIGAGGGSIAWINKALGNRLEVGPRSARAYPGPACYRQGGTEPTVTDADVVLGYINPDNFLGGRMKLDAGKSLLAMDRIAKPLGISRIEAAMAIRTIVDANMGNTLAAELSQKGEDPREFVLFAYGGAGPVHCAGYNSQLGARKIMVFPASSEFSALGGAVMDPKHIYEASRHIVLRAPGEASVYLDDFTEFNSIVDRLKESTTKDIVMEGFQAEDVIFTLEVEARYGTQLALTRFLSPRLHITNQDDIKAICDAFYQKYVQRYGELSALPERGIAIESLYLAGMIPLVKPVLPTGEISGEDAGQALIGTREIWWKDHRQPRKSDIYSASFLKPGNVIHGPAIVEATDTTIVIPPETRYSIDRYYTGIFETE
jgi:N-methylhydantoinase A/oxoprolinase/acetone carboxylase beta subunit